METVAAARRTFNSHELAVIEKQQAASKLWDLAQPNETGAGAGVSGRGPKRERSKVASNGMTYADWLTKAIESVADRRLTLAEIYDWMVVNVPGLSGQRYLHSSKGWKNAVRHTLSVNARFCKIARPGRPSFWATASTNPTPFASTPMTIGVSQSESRSRKKRTRTVSSPLPTVLADEGGRDHKRSRTVSSPAITDFSTNSIISTTSITPPARTPQQNVETKYESPNGLGEISAPCYMIEYYQIPLALAAVAASASRVFKPKPTFNFRISPTSAFVSFRPRQEATTG